MKKIILSILFITLLIIEEPIMVYGGEFVEPIQLNMDTDCQGCVDISLYVSPDNDSVINYIYFYNLDTGQEYYAKFNNYNHEGESLWEERFFIPNGRYALSSQVAGDTFGSFILKTESNTITVSDDVQSITCLIGRSNWIEENISLLEPTPTPTIVVASTPTPMPVITTVPTLTEMPEIQVNDTKTDKVVNKADNKFNYIVLVVGGVIIGILAVVLLKKKR